MENIGESYIGWVLTKLNLLKELLAKPTSNIVYAALQFSYSLLKFLKQKSSPHQFFEAGKEFSVIVCGLNERILCAREIFHLVTPLK